MRDLGSMRASLQANPPLTHSHHAALVHQHRDRVTTVASVEVVVLPGHLVVSHDLQQVSVDELIKVIDDITSTAHSSGSEW